MQESVGIGPVLGPIIAKKLADGTFRLPTPPAAAMRVMELLRSEDLDARLVTRAIEKDPALAAQVLRAANAVAFRGRVATTNLGQAVTRLGSRQLRAFLVAAVAHQLFVSKDRELDKVLAQVRAHSVAVSILARDLAHLIRSEEVEETYLAGLLHDIGKVVLLSFILEVLREHRRGVPLRFAPDHYLPALRRLHRSLGAKLIALWELPYLQAVVAASHAYDPSRRLSPGNLVCFANAMTKRLRIYESVADPHEIGASLMVGRSVLGIDEDLIDRVCLGLGERVKDL